MKFLNNIQKSFDDNYDKYMYTNNKYKNFLKKIIVNVKMLTIRLDYDGVVLKYNSCH